MVLSCSAYNCTQRYTKGVSFHGFSKDEELRKKWIHVTRRDNFTPSKQSKLCDKHFTSDCYDTSPWSSQKKLKNDAIPSIFDFPAHLRKHTKHRKSPTNRENISNKITNNSIQNINVDSSQINPITKPESDIGTPENSKKFLKLTKSKLAAKKKTIKTLQQSKLVLL